MPCSRCHSARRVLVVFRRCGGGLRVCGGSGLVIEAAPLLWGVVFFGWIISWGARLAGGCLVSCVGGLRAFGCGGAMLTFTESLILAQDERWRRA